MKTYPTLCLRTLRYHTQDTIQLDTLNILLHAQQLVPKPFVNHAHENGIAVHFIEHLLSEEDKYEGF